MASPMSPDEMLRLMAQVRQNSPTNMPPYMPTYTNSCPLSRGDILIATPEACARYRGLTEDFAYRITDINSSGSEAIVTLDVGATATINGGGIAIHPSSQHTGIIRTEFFIPFGDYMKKTPRKTTTAAPKKFDITHLDPLIIDPAVKDEIASVIKQHKNKDVLFTEWGLGDVIEYGRGMTLLFYGGPGTGKTWAAHCIAKVLGTELLTISAAEIQSSEPGAANRNIQQAFKTAQKEGKVLFLDECDSLIMNRSDLGMVLAGEVNTLLTEIEKSEGVVILATNRIESMDEALERRISLIAEFPAPDKEQRVEIWKKMLPKKMPISKDVSPEDLAKHRLTGGQIKNAVLAAARLALAQEKKEVSLSHFTTAIDRILASKNLMGTASRYHQGPVDDFARSSGMRNASRDVKSFIGTELDKVKTDDIDVDIDTDIDITPTPTPTPKKK